MNAAPQSAGTGALDALHSAKQTADYLGVDYFTLARWRGEGKGPTFIRVGRQIRYRERDLLAWLESENQ